MTAAIAVVAACSSPAPACRSYALEPIRDVKIKLASSNCVSFHHD